MLDLRNGVGQQVNIVVPNCRNILLIQMASMPRLPLHPHPGNQLLLNFVTLNDISQLILLLNRLLHVLILQMFNRSSKPHQPRTRLTLQVPPMVNTSPIVSRLRLLLVPRHGFALEMILHLNTKRRHTIVNTLVDLDLLQPNEASRKQLPELMRLLSWICLGRGATFDEESDQLALVDVE